MENKETFQTNLLDENKKTDSNEEDDLSEKDNLQKSYNVILSRKIRIFIFILFLVLSVVVDLDNGIFNSSVNYLQKDLDMNQTDYGIFVSVSFIGRIIGLVIFMIIINFKHRKFTLILTIFLHASSYILYSIKTNNNSNSNNSEHINKISNSTNINVINIINNIDIINNSSIQNNIDNSTNNNNTNNDTNNSSNYSFLFIFAKMFTAANKVCASVYRPVWIEQFGLSNYKTVFFSLVQIMSSYGQTIGFNLGTLYFKEKWQLALICIMILMFIIVFLFILIPGKYFYRKYMYHGEILVDTVDENENENESYTSDRASTVSKRSSKISRKTTLFVNSKKIKNKNKNENYTFKNLLNDLLSLIKNKIYVLSIIKRSNSTFIFQIIHSYLKIYQEKAFEESNENLIALFYSISTLLATAIGGLLGGMIAKFLGGYNSKKSILVVIIPGILTCIFISFLAFTSSFYIYNINLILFFCFVSAGTPVIQGYLIINIPKDIKSIGVGLDMIISTFLGKIPGPIIYGILEDKYSIENPSFAWKICLSYFYVGFILDILICYFKYHEEIKENASEVKLEDQIVDIAAIGSGSDSNDPFRLKIPVPKRSKTTYRKSNTIEFMNIIPKEDTNDMAIN